MKPFAVKNVKEDMSAVKLIRQLAYEALQRNDVPLSTIVGLIGAGNVEEAVRILEAAKMREKLKEL